MVKGGPSLPAAAARLMGLAARMPMAAVQVMGATQPALWLHQDPSLGMWLAWGQGGNPWNPRYLCLPRIP